ncbi:LOW QUALITY PROTEIN: protein PXR1-like [Apis dorsata]|uniref:LOW QUALITY PROTEIN: protein PXR1-like n=1 Tax=Apis dorsata TaxID=7462 RepID=UPI001293A42D|nr:LOW QUALITY PROTEIN: protein PXR1-like [Apis dorsata]
MSRVRGDEEEEEEEEEVEVEVEVELEVAVTKKVIEEGEHGKEAVRKRKSRSRPPELEPWIVLRKKWKERKREKKRKREPDRMEGIEKRQREEEIDEKKREQRKENIHGSPGGYERGKAERRNSKIVENVYAPSGWPRFSQDLLSRQHFSLSSAPLVQCMGKPLVAARSWRKSQVHIVRTY